MAKSNVVRELVALGVYPTSNDEILIDASEALGFTASEIHKAMIARDKRQQALDAEERRNGTRTKKQAAEREKVKAQFSALGGRA